MPDQSLYQLFGSTSSGGDEQLNDEEVRRLGISPQLGSVYDYIPVYDNDGDKVLFNWNGDQVTYLLFGLVIFWFLLLGICVIGGSLLGL